MAAAASQTAAGQSAVGSNVADINTNAQKQATNNSASVPPAKETAAAKADGQWKKNNTGWWYEHEMCIRDRVDVNAEEQNKNRQLFQEVYSKFSSDAYIAVSYTHLDVYKRQLSYSSKLQLSISSCEFCNSYSLNGILQKLQLPPVFPLSGENPQRLQ